MSEIKTPVEKMPEGEQYTFGPDEYLIKERHTLSDVLRFLVSQAGDDPSEIRYILDYDFPESA